jgi:hypothetical protein
VEEDSSFYFLAVEILVFFEDLPDFKCSLHPIHPWHVEIHQDHVKYDIVAVCEKIYSFMAALASFHFYIFEIWLDKHFYWEQVKRLIINYEDYQIRWGFISQIFMSFHLQLF